MEGGINLIDLILKNQTEIETQSQNTLEAVNGICPEIRDTICTDVLNISTCDFEVVFQEDGAVDTISDFFEAVGDTKEDVFDDLMSARADLVELLQIADNMNDFR